MAEPRGIVGTFKWYVASMMGDNHYERYLPRV